MDRRIYDHPQRTFPRGEPISIVFDGTAYRAYAGEPVAVALFASGVKVLSRSIKYHRPRSFFCLDGHCGGCLMRIDGQPNMRTCMEPCREGMELATQNVLPAGDIDVLGALDWLFPKGFDHHGWMTGSKVMNQAMQKVTRHLSGLGKLPESRDLRSQGDPNPAVRKRSVDVVIVGAGPAGLAAATESARLGAKTLCIDEQSRPGGSLLCEPTYGPEEALVRVRAARDAGVELIASATGLGWYPEDEGGLLLVATLEGLVHLRARRYIYATGAYDANLLFDNNDRPGVFSARAVGRLVAVHGVRPGEHVVVVGDSPYANALMGELNLLGVRTTSARGRCLRAHGQKSVGAVEVANAEGKPYRISCDAVAVAEMPAPASELVRQHGARVAFRPDAGGFAALVVDGGRTHIPGVFACGDVTGYVGPERAAEQGRQTGIIAASEVVRG